MNILSVILGVVFLGVIGVLCLFSCILSNKSDEYWEELKRKCDKSGR